MVSRSGLKPRTFLVNYFFMNATNRQLLNWHLWWFFSKLLFSRFVHDHSIAFHWKPIAKFKLETWNGGFQSKSQNKFIYRLVYCRDQKYGHLKSGILFFGMAVLPFLCNGLLRFLVNLLRVIQLFHLIFASYLLPLYLYCIFFNIYIS